MVLGMGYVKSLATQVGLRRTLNRTHEPYSMHEMHKIEDIRRSMVASELDSYHDISVHELVIL
jgi:hypothetical protein